MKIQLANKTDNSNKIIYLPFPNANKIQINATENGSQVASLVMMQ